MITNSLSWQSRMVDETSKNQIHKHFIQALQGPIQSHSDISEVPMEVEATYPLPPKLRVYAYNVTTPPGSGSNGEHIARLIVPDQDQGERSSFDHSGGHLVLLVGYAAQSEVFILWDAGLHREFRYSKPVKVDPGPVFKAVAGEIGTQERHLQTGTETVLTANANNLENAIQIRSKLTTERLTK